MGPEVRDGVPDVPGGRDEGLMKGSMEDREAGGVTWGEGSRKNKRCCRVRPRETRETWTGRDRPYFGKSQGGPESERVGDPAGVYRRGVPPKRTGGLDVPGVGRENWYCVPGQTEKNSKTVVLRENSYTNRQTNYRPDTPRSFSGRGTTLGSRA